MNKTIRFLLILAVLVVVVVVAGSRVAWASPGPAAPAEKAAPAPAAVAQHKGTVNVPESDLIVVKGTDCPVPVHGVATLCGLSADTNVRGSLGPQPDGYLSKIVNLNFTAGAARLCFAAPLGNELIYTQINDTWTALLTIYADGQVCVDVSASGQYVLGQ